MSINLTTSNSLNSSQDAIASGERKPIQDVPSADDYITERDIFGEYHDVIEINGSQLLIDMGFKALAPRKHPLEAKIAQHETNILGYYAIEYEGFINVFGEGDEIVGGLILQRRWNTAIIYSFFLESHLRGMGLGKRILSLAEHMALQMGASSLVLETSTLHTYEFYLRNGFTVLCEVNGYIDGQTWFHMFKNLMVSESADDQKSNLSEEAFLGKELSENELSEEESPQELNKKEGDNDKS